MGDAGARVRIVGEALFPSDVHAEFDEGLWLAPAQFDAVVPPIGPRAPSATSDWWPFALRPGAPLRASIGRLQSELGSAVPGHLAARASRTS